MSPSFTNCKHHIPWPFCDVCASADSKETYRPIEPAGGGSSDYYDLPPDCQTLQDVIVKKQMDFTRGNIFKAAYRWDVKPGLQYNLEKIIWFAQDALNRIYAEERKKARPE